MEKSDSITKFLDKKMIDAPHTRNSYRYTIQTYFMLLDKDMNTYFREIPEDKKEREKIFSEYDTDLRKVYKIQKEKGRPELSMRTFFNPVKQYMITNEKQLGDLEFWDTLKAHVRGAEPENDEAILNASDIKTILSHGNACSRALFLMLASSGRRISEILALTPNDVHTEEVPSWINVKKGLTRESTKTKQKTSHCFISNEASDAYKTWMKERDHYLEQIYKKYPDKIDRNDPRVFPMSYHNSLTIWTNLLIKAKLIETEDVKDKWTGRMKRKPKKDHAYQRLLQHPHCLRKFYRSYLGDADLAEFLMGHGTMLTKTYRQMKPEDLAKKYLAVMPNVTIFESPLALEEINKKQQDLEKANMEKDKQLSEMQKTIEEMKAQILELRLEKLEQQNGIKSIHHGKKNL